MAIHNTASDAANTAVIAFLTKVGALYEKIAEVFIKAVNSNGDEYGYME